MTVFLNGEFVPEERAMISVFDRSFLYGDGLFETIRVVNGKPFRWEQHLRRISSGAGFLKINLPRCFASLRASADQLIAANQMPESLLRLTLSRGVGLRGYSPKGADEPSIVMSLHPAPPIDLEKAAGWQLAVSSVRLPAGEPLAAFKTCNKLPQILAKAEAEEAGADEAVLLNTDGYVVEAASSNLFWITEDRVFTPPLASGILPGVTRAVVFELCNQLRIGVGEAEIKPEQLQKIDGLFLSLSSAGIVGGISLNGKSLAVSPLTNKLRAAYWELVRAETR